MKTFLKWAGISLALLVAAKVAWNAVVNSAQNALFAPEDYTRTVETGGPIEAKYMAMGSCEVEKLEVPAPEEDWGKFVAYYPAGLAESGGQYPVVVMVNGTGVGASKYPACSSTWPPGALSWWAMTTPAPAPATRRTPLWRGF